jgi:hypothetical protein
MIGPVKLANKMCIVAVVRMKIQPIIEALEASKPTPAKQSHSTFV